ncbi:MAG TPA: nucleoside-diphosphate sugar epimerase/dehydratase [Phycisphaerae bacterium]|nr:nucleoside-diphosphate sugar epimerase/dehydratase [Phycisphaerae bacterium]
MDSDSQLTNNNGGWANWARSHHLLVSALAHIGLFAVAWLLAFGLAYNFQRYESWFTLFFLPLLPAVLLVKLIVFGAMGLHRGSWRYVSMRDVIHVTGAAWLSFVWIFGIYYALVNAEFVVQTAARWLGVEGFTFTFDPFGGHDFPDSVLLLDFAGTIAVVCGARILVRLYHEEVEPVADGGAPKLLILGAGDAGATVAREILRMPVLNYRPVGFLDDDSVKRGAQIHGIEVLGPISKLKAVCEEYGVDEILIAMPSATRAEVRRVVDLCQGVNLRFKTLPALADLIAGRTQVQQIRDVDINDLLGRAPVTLDEDEIAKFIRSRVVMVTGAGGSIGSEMCRQIARFKPKRLVLAEQAEQHLFDIDRELKAKFGEIDIVPYIADIGDLRRIERVFSTERPTAVLHAAAHKHVPMMEHNPGEAIKNNIHGTRVIADAAARYGCEKFVMISSDKAVNPTSIMGCTKRVAEMYIQGLSERGDTQFVSVRFGNVLGSSGSVIPIFKEQIARGEPVTVTHPDMVRYFMTIPEAAQLVLQAASMGRGGEIFVLDMGDPVKIVDLARDLITLSGFRPEEDIEITFVGIRPGEKLYEELAIEGEDVSRTAHPKIGIWQNRPVEWEALLEAIAGLLDRADDLSREEARGKLKKIVPEFHLEPPLPPAVQPPPATDSQPPAAKKLASA